MIWIICFSTALLHSSGARSHILSGEEEWKGHKREVLLTKLRPGWCQVVSSCTVLKKQVWKVGTLPCKVVRVYLVRLPEPWNYYLSFDIYFINLSKLLRAQEFQGSGVATPLEWLLEKLKAFSQLLFILGSYFLEN